MEKEKVSDHHVDSDGSTCPNCEVMKQKLEHMKTETRKQIAMSQFALQNILKIMGGRGKDWDSVQTELNGDMNNGHGVGQSLNGDEGAATLNSNNNGENGVGTCTSNEAGSHHEDREKEVPHTSGVSNNDMKRKGNLEVLMETEKKRSRQQQQQEEGNLSFKKSTEQKTSEFLTAASYDWTKPQKKCHILRFSYDDVKKTYTLSGGIGGIHNLTLADLNECLKELKEEEKFPCNSFSFSFRADTTLEEPEFKEFIHLHGHSIKTFDFILSTFGSPNIPAFRRLLLEQMDQLETLCIWSLPCDPKISHGQEGDKIILHNKNEGSTDQRSLPNLKTVKMLQAVTGLHNGDCHHEGYSHFNNNVLSGLVAEVVKAAVNLEKYESQFDLYQDIECLTSLIEANKITVIKINFNPENLRIYEKLADAHVTLKEIEFTRFCPQDHPYVNRKDQNSHKINHVLSVAIARILKNSQNTLDQVTLKTSCHEVPPDVTWPELTNVTRLIMDPVKVIRSRRQSNLVDLPDLFTTIIKLPVLTSVTLVSSLLDSPSVRHFSSPLYAKVKHPCDDALLLCLTEIVQHFPKLTHLSLQKVDKFSQIAPILWSCRSLQSLELELCIDKKLSRGSSSAVDAAFTGFSVETCMNLQWKLKENTKLPCPERNHPSILDLDDLQDLKIKFSPKDRHAYFENDFSFRSKNVSFVYAFDLMPQLCVKVFKNGETT